MRTRYKIILILVLTLLLVGWRASTDIAQGLADRKESLLDFLWENSVTSAKSDPLADNQALYGDASQDTDVHRIYLIVLPTKDGNGQTLTLETLNAVDDYLAAKPVLNVQFIDGDNKLPDDVEAELMNTPVTGNATLTVRGHSTLISEKKSYKIRLNNDTADWNKQIVINLNKHPFDDSRMRNKIAFDLFRLIPNITSMQTKFVHMYIKDLSENMAGSFVDYGLFTQIEQVNKQFLKVHGLDENGSLYKANYFEFQRYSDNLKNIDDPTYNQGAFEQHLEICAGTSHEKIIQMIDDVNNASRDIDLVLDKYFNRDNYFSWLAVNILLGNYDTQTQNYFLYSPHDSLTWYFLPWDYDGSMFPNMTFDADGKPAQLRGIANYWSNVLHARVFQKEHNVAELNARIESIYKILTTDVMNQETEKYLPVIRQYYFEDPAFNNNEFTSDEFYNNIDFIKNIVEANYNLYYSTLGKPMPIFLGDIEKNSDGTIFTWSESFDLQGDRISYTLQISRNLQFTDLVFEKTRLTTNQFIVNLKPGTYYWRIIITDDNGETQRAFDVYWKENTDMILHAGVFGIKKIIIG